MNKVILGWHNFSEFVLWFIFNLIYGGSRGLAVMGDTYNQEVVILNPDTR